MGSTPFRYPRQKWSVLIDVQSDERPTRLLRPVEFEYLLEGSKSEKNKLLLQVALITGMRYEELRRFSDNPEWYNEDENFIFIPVEYKRERKHSRRYVRLPSIARTIIPKFFELNLKYPTIQTWIENLRRWALKGGLDPSYLGGRTLRKTWECWLVLTYPHRIDQVVLNQGHTIETSLKHYLNVPFSQRDIEDMRKWTEGW